MGRQLIGQVLSRMGKLSAMDIDEILEEQALSGRRFGEIAIGWGLCEAGHIGEAWCRQLAEEGTALDLNQVGIDLHAARLIPGELARRLGVVPLRALGDILIVATSHPLDSVAVAELSRAVARDLRFVIVDVVQIERALRACYALAVAA